MRIAGALVAANAELRWCDMSPRGYMTTTFTPARVTNEWLMPDTIAQRSRTARAGHTATVEHGRNVSVAPDQPTAINRPSRALTRASAISSITACASRAGTGTGPPAPIAPATPA